MKPKIIVAGSIIAVSALALGIWIGTSLFLPANLGLKNSTSVKSQAPGDDQEILYWRAPMDPTEMYDEPGKSLMGMDLVPVFVDEETVSGAGQVSISSVVAQNMGVRYADAKRIDLFRSIRTVAEVMVDEEKVYQVNARISGWVEKLHVGFGGARIEKGQALLEIYSPELVSTQQEYLLAKKHFELVSGSRDAATITDASRMIEASLARLRNWEIPEDAIRSLQETGEVQRTVLLRSPATGIVMKKQVIEGDHIEIGKNLFQIADLRSVWVHASLFDNELLWIREGQVARVELSHLPGITHVGEVSYIYPLMRERARDVHVRIILENDDLKIKPGMFANVELEGRHLENVIVVPTEAIIRSGERSLVFVANGEGNFDPIEVVLGAEGGEGNRLVHVISGLEEGARVVVSAQFLIDSESRLQEAIQKLRVTSTESSEPTMELDTMDGDVMEMGEMKMPVAEDETK